MPDRVAEASATEALKRPSADLAVALAVSAVVAVWTLLQMRSGGEPPGRALIGWGLIALGCGALYFRRRRPVAVGVITLLTSCVHYPVSVTDGPLMITFAVALYTLAVSRTDSRRRRAAEVSTAPCEEG
ncbi:hypothetical protein [Streptomyces sp. NPDC127033]|uniref:DUF7134 domain-containing protein n=1 Tax=Streptomyces sp. NPDC127033 TaxID=3347110 RepID=UPI00364EB3B4